MIRTLVGLILALTISGPIPVQALTVEEAYSSIPHQRTVFESQATKLSMENSKALARTFEAIDQLIVLKQSVLTRQFAGNTAVLKARYAQISDQISAALSSPSLSAFRQQLLAGVQAQLDYLTEAILGEIPLGVNPAHAKIRAASAQLHQAYTTLMKLFPEENAHNKQAFYDYLCALDMV